MYSYAHHWRGAWGHFGRELKHQLFVLYGSNIDANAEVLGKYTEDEVVLAADDIDVDVKRKFYFDR